MHRVYSKYIPADTPEALDSWYCPSCLEVCTCAGCVSERKAAKEDAAAAVAAGKGSKETFSPLVQKRSISAPVSAAQTPRGGKRGLTASRPDPPAMDAPLPMAFQQLSEVPLIDQRVRTDQSMPGSISSGGGGGGGAGSRRMSLNTTAGLPDTPSDVSTASGRQSVSTTTAGAMAGMSMRERENLASSGAGASQPASAISSAASSRQSTPGHSPAVGSFNTKKRARRTTSNASQPSQHATMVAFAVPANAPIEVLPAVSLHPSLSFSSSTSPRHLSLQQQRVHSSSPFHSSLPPLAADQILSQHQRYQQQITGLEAQKHEIAMALQAVAQQQQADRLALEQAAGRFSPYAPANPQNSSSSSSSTSNPTPAQQQWLENSERMLELQRQQGTQQMSDLQRQLAHLHSMHSSVSPPASSASPHQSGRLPQQQHQYTSAAAAAALGGSYRPSPISQSNLSYSSVSVPVSPGTSNPSFHLLRDTSSSAISTRQTSSIGGGAGAVGWNSSTMQSPYDDVGRSRAESLEQQLAQQQQHMMAQQGGGGGGATGGAMLSTAEMMELRSRLDQHQQQQQAASFSPISVDDHEMAARMQQLEELRQQQYRLQHQISTNVTLLDPSRMQYHQHQQQQQQHAPLTADSILEQQSRTQQFQQHQHQLQVPPGLHSSASPSSSSVALYTDLAYPLPTIVSNDNSRSGSSLSMHSVSGGPYSAGGGGGHVRASSIGGGIRMSGPFTGYHSSSHHYSRPSSMDLSGIIKTEQFDTPGGGGGGGAAGTSHFERPFSSSSGMNHFDPTALLNSSLSRTSQPDPSLSGSGIPPGFTPPGGGFPPSTQHRRKSIEIHVKEEDLASGEEDAHAAEINATLSRTRGQSDPVHSRRLPPSAYSPDQLLIMGSPDLEAPPKRTKQEQQQQQSHSMPVASRRIGAFEKHSPPALAVSGMLSGNEIPLAAGVSDLQLTPVGHHAFSPTGHHHHMLSPIASSLHPISPTTSFEDGCAMRSDVDGQLMRVQSRLNGVGTPAELTTHQRDLDKQEELNLQQQLGILRTFANIMQGTNSQQTQQQQQQPRRMSIASNGGDENPLFRSPPPVDPSHDHDMSSDQQQQRHQSSPAPLSSPLRHPHQDPSFPHLSAPLLMAEKSNASVVSGGSAGSAGRGSAGGRGHFEGFGAISPPQETVRSTPPMPLPTSQTSDHMEM
jgi:hypothetical protein